MVNNTDHTKIWLIVYSLLHIANHAMWIHTCILFDIETIQLTVWRKLGVRYILQILQDFPMTASLF